MKPLIKKPRPIRHLQTVFNKPLMRIAVPALRSEASSSDPIDPKIDTPEHNIDMYRADLARFIGKRTNDHGFPSDKAA